MKPQLFIFDLDGTLIDSRGDLAAATNRMRSLHGLGPLPLERVAAYVGDGVRMLARRALEGAQIDPDQAAREIGAAYAEHLTDRTTAYAGVDEGLRALRAAGHDLALATNKPAVHARRLCEHFGWTPLLAVLLGGGDTEELKPSPLPLQAAMAHTGHGPDTTWMVGDHHTDLEAARRAGVRSIYLESGFGNPGDEIPDLKFAGFEAFTSHFLGATPPCPP
jgi:phosphoglycolate phosphatase